MIPKVSVIIPTYNRAANVQKAIDSVLAQTFADLEIVVVDDGSSDDTGPVLRNKYCDRIRYFFQSNQGASVARNRGVAEARGEWIAFLDSDDLWEPEKLEWQLRALEKFGSPCGACYTDVRFFNHAETRTFFQLAEQSYRHAGELGMNPEAMRLAVRPGGAGMVICLSSLMARAYLAKRTQFDTKLLYSQDSDFMFRLAMLTGFCYVNRPLVRFDRAPAEIRHVGVSADWNKIDFFLKDSQLRLEGLLRLGDTVPKPLQAVIREQLSLIHSGWANWYLEKGNYAKARASALSAMRENLTLNFAAKWLLAWVSPRLALRTVRQRRENRKDAVTV